MATGNVGGKRKRSSAYSEKLKDPRWQKMRLKILERDDFACQICGDSEETLHVHHKRYVWGNDPWDYPDEVFATLCEECHDDVSMSKKEAEGKLLDAVRMNVLSPHNVECIAEALEVMLSSYGEDDVAGLWDSIKCDQYLAYVLITLSAQSISQSTPAMLLMEARRCVRVFAGQDGVALTEDEHTRAAADAFSATDDPRAIAHQSRLALTRIVKERTNA
jgi:hypothetical protein